MLDWGISAFEVTEEAAGGSLVIQPLVVRDAKENCPCRTSWSKLKLSQVQLFGLAERMRWAGRTHEGDPGLNDYLKNMKVPPEELDMSELDIFSEEPNKQLILQALDRSCKPFSATLTFCDW